MSLLLVSGYNYRQDLTCPAKENQMYICGAWPAQSVNGGSAKSIYMCDLDYTWGGGCHDNLIQRGQGGGGGGVDGH